MKYRADIDGLRSVAIIPVVLYHAGISMFSGGFVGVDVFFVISGYLITSIILSDIDKDRFTITNFYFRRVKRIFPALYLLFIFTSVFCLFFYMPADLKAYGKSLFGSVFFISNVVFWREKGYFEAASELKPLLHTWSLSVEEQFYIFYPVMMLLLAKYFRKRYVSAVFVVFTMSFLLCLWGTVKYSSASFFLLPTRAWELMIGCLLALGFFPKTGNVKLLNLLSASGIILIFYSVFSFDSETKFPGFMALIPCAGTALIIYSGCFVSASSDNAKPIINKILSFKPFVIVGLISYSLYLWHWVLFAFRNYYKDVANSVLMSNWVLIPLSFIFAAVSYYIVEKPFRDIKWEDRKKLFAYSFAIMIVFALAGMVTAVESGFPARFSDKVSIYSFGREDKRLFRDNKYYKLGVENIEPSFLLWGDSHAMAIAPGIDEIAKKMNKSGLFINMGGCPPVWGIAKQGRTSCIEFNKKVFEKVSSMPIKNVILASRWGYIYAEMMTDSREDIEQIAYGENDFEKNKRVFSQGFETIVRKLNQTGKEVTVFTGVPVNKFNIPDTLAKSEFIKTNFPSYFKNIEIRYKTEEFRERQTPDNMIFETTAEKYKLNIVHLEKVLCRGEFCDVTAENNVPYYFDESHLSVSGAKFVCEELRDEIAPFL